MAQVKECMEKAYECSKIRNVVPKNCLHKTDKYIICKCQNSRACKCLKSIACNKLKKYVQPCRPDPYIPVPQTCMSDAPFAGNTVYGYSFHSYGCESRQQPIIHKDHLVMAGEFQGETVHKLSYPVQCAPVVQKITPKDHCLGGKGPMRTTTTQQHDYYGQCVDREKSILPQGNIGLFDCPMVGLTTTNLSYQPVCADKVENYKPNKCYTAPEDNMDLNTVHRSSYKNVGLAEKAETPWAEKLNYCRPNKAIECCTVYNYSYKEPGEYVSEDCCEINSVIKSKLTECCCPFTCLADNIEEQSKSPFIKAHQFED